MQKLINIIQIWLKLKSKILDILFRVINYCYRLLKKLALFSKPEGFL